MDRAAVLCGCRPSLHSLVSVLHSLTQERRGPEGSEATEAASHERFVAGVSNETIGTPASLWSLYRPFMDRAVHFVQLCYRLMRVSTVLTRSGLIFAHFAPRTTRPRGCILSTSDDIKNAASTQRPRGPATTPSCPIWRRRLSPSSSPRRPATHTCSSSATAWP